MNPDILKDREYYAFAHGAANGQDAAQRVGADWLDDHDSPVRAHIFRHGAKEHQVAERGPAVAQTIHPHRHDPENPFPGWQWVSSEPSHPGVILPDEGKNIRRLDNPTQPLAHADLGREHLELFRARSIAHPNDTRFVIRYTLRFGSRRLRLIAPATHEVIQAIADQVPYTNPSGMPAHWDWYAKQVPREQPEGDKATHLARPADYPAFIQSLRGIEPGHSHAVFADYLEERGIPGAHVARAHTDAKRGTPIKELLLLGPTPKILDSKRGSPSGRYRSTPFERMRSLEMRERPVGQVAFGNGMATVAVAHRVNPGDRRLVGDKTEHIIHRASAETPEQLEALIADWPRWAQEHVRNGPAMAHLKATQDPTKLARVTIGPGSPMLAIRGDSAAHHEIYGDQGQRIGSVRVIDRGPMLHLDMVEGDLGIAGARALHDQLAEQYPKAQYLVGDRTTGWRRKIGMSGKDFVLPIRRRATKLARMQAPTGGAIVNKTYQKGGQFLAKAFKSIRAVADRLRASQLAREPQASVGAAFDRHPTGAADDRITLGELKRVEEEHQLPHEERLSPRIDPQPPGAQGDEHPYTANVLDIARFVDSLVRKRIPSSHLKGVLADDKKTPDQKFMHLVTHLLAEHHAAPHISWYGEHMNTLDRLLHQRFASGPSDPLWGTLDSKGELVGKHDPATHHPANVLFKALVAATSASQTPVDNLASAIKIWKDGAESGDPILHAPHYNVRELKKWTDHVDPGVLASTGSTPEQKARWYAQHIYGKYDFGEGKTPYSSITAKVLMMDDPTDPRHGLLLSYDKNGRKVKGKDAPATIPAGGKSVTVDLPLTNAGGIRAKGWARYGAQTATGIAKLQAIVQSFSGPNKTLQQSYQDAARWLLSAHTPEDFDARMKKAKLIKTVNSDKVYGEGYLKKEDKEGIPGSFIFGPKFGAFFLNLHANDPHTREPMGSYLTADKWWTRTWNRYLGNIILPGRREIKADPEKGIKGRKAKGATIDESLGANKRRLMRRVTEEVAKQAGVTPAELQADLWYYEQSLYRMLGAKSADSFSYADAANKFLHPDSPHRLARKKKSPAPTQYSSALYTPEMAAWIRQVRPVPVGKGPFGVAHHTGDVFADWLSDQGAWQALMYRGKLGVPYTPEGAPSVKEWKRPDGLTIQNGLARSRYVESKVSAVEPEGPGKARHVVTSFGYHDPNTPVVMIQHRFPKEEGEAEGPWFFTIHTPQEYKELRDAAATSGNHFPEAPKTHAS